MTATSIGADVVCEGWVLKKRRKKMQGFARRYFVLHRTGLLSYSFEPGQPIRDQLSLRGAAVSTSPGRKDIHVDSSTATFHLKCLDTQDFNTWMSAFRKFIFLGTDTRRPTGLRSPVTSSVREGQCSTLVETISVTISSLEDSLHLMIQELFLTPGKQHYNKKFDKEKSKDTTKDHASRFGLFKRSSHYPLSQDSAENTSTSSVDNLPHTVRHVLSILESLKSQHATLLASVSVPIDPNAMRSTSPIPITAGVQQRTDIHFVRSPNALSNTSRHMSVATTLTDSTHEWFDALDGAEEFIVDVRPITHEIGQTSSTIACESQTSLGDQESKSSATDCHESQHDPDLPPSVPTTAEVVYRNRLPTSPTWVEGSLFAILKNNVGKDLSSITLPVTFNEPLSLLQCAAEDLEYHNLLDEAAQSIDPVDRMCYVAAFAVSSYAHTRHRSGRKGFNPMLAETFEDQRMKFIAEKVRHNPLEIAYHAEGDGWKLTASSSGKTKFWGKSLEIIPLGNTCLTIGNDQFKWKKPSSFIRNLVVGTKYFEHVGNLEIENTRVSTSCVLEFKQNGFWGPSNAVSGTVYGPLKTVLCRLEGKWDDHIARTLDATNFKILWKMNPFPKDTYENYGFTVFGITLNELTGNIVDNLPPTDSRFRPDVRSLENGDLESAEKEKARIEEKQRERRRQGRDRCPRWFEQCEDGWIYRGGYWQAREERWEGEEIPSLW